MLPILHAAALLLAQQPSPPEPTPSVPTFERRVRVHVPASVADAPVDGRLLLLVAKDDSVEPRFTVRPTVESGAAVFGLDLTAQAADSVLTFEGDVFGYPVESLQDLAPGEYVVQAMLHRYERFQMAHGHSLLLPMDRGEGQHWNVAPGNLHSAPQRVQLGLDATTTTLELDHVVPPIERPQDTRYVRHVRMKSDRLSAFYGRPMELGAVVLVPEGFDEHPEARYPVCIFHGHFEHDFGGFRTEPPDPNLEPDYSERFRLSGYNRIQQEEAYAFYREWTSADFPRFLVVQIQHANPFYDDSYAVNSANVGPYGDAITYELLPYLEREFRGLGAGWSRFLYGGSTGGWEALAAQIFYPDEYNGCFAACPDPIDFRAYCLVDVYGDANAYWVQGPFGRLERPGHRNWLGQVNATVRGFNHLELALATNGRSGEQFDIWQAVFSPLGPDGYPAPIWDKRTGRIDPAVAAYWREHFDLRHILQRDWATLGPRLVGKLHVYCGDMDNYYLNNAVYLMEEFLESTTDPPYGGEVDYGDRAEHCWNGDQENPNAISRLRYNTMYLPRILERIAETAPPGADLTSWRY